MSAPMEVTAWLVTYVLHSTILLGFALLVAPRLRTDAWRETLWRTALLGSLVTATFQTAVAYTPVVGRWTLQGVQDVGRVPPRIAPAAGPAEPEPAAPRLPAAAYEADVEGAEAGDRVAAGPVPSAPSTDAANRSESAGGGPGSIAWGPLMIQAWAVVAALLLMRLVMQHALLFGVLRERRAITTGRVFRMLAELRSSASRQGSVRLSASAVCPTPIALGRVEICVPERFLTDLDPDQQRTALAHELAHLQRRDPLWQLAAGVVEAVLFFQPLNRVARRRLRDVAENLCDDWAVRQTGSALGLARCLADIASWIGPVPLPGSAPAMASRGSALLRRVERLADWKEPSGLPPRLRQLASAALVALVAVAAPGVSHADPAESLPTPLAGGGDKPKEIKPMDTTATEAPQPEPTLAGEADLPAPSDSLIVHTDPSASLAERWRWALGRDLPDGYWVAWGVEGGVRSPEVVLECPNGMDNCRKIVSEQGVVSSDSHDPAGDAPDAPSVQQRLGGAAGGAPPLALVFRIGGSSARRGEVEWIRLRSASAPLDLRGRPLVWLGRAGTQESLAQLRELYPRLGGPMLRKEVAAALTLHEGEAGVVQALRGVLESEQNVVVRTEAVKWLSRGQRGGREVFDFFVRTALDDPSPAVRHKAVSRLGRVASPQTSAVLLDLAQTAPHPEVREEAVDQLANNRAALLRLSRDAKDPRVRRDAVKSLAVGRSDDVVPLLLEIAFQDPVERVRREAARQLAGFRSEASRQALARIVETHPEGRIRREAAAGLPAGR